MTSTLTAPPTPTAGEGDERIGIVGNRHLVGVQTFDVSRLTTDPVPLVPGTFIAVSGQGPKGDSNGSGKTSFLAAVSLLLGDAQWRLEGTGAQDAHKMLFSPASAGLPADSGYAPASTGYVVGVFADPTDPVATALTVWLRLSATPQYLRVRWTTGLHVATGETDLERYDQADALWNALPRNHEIGPRTMRETLYGSAPRAIAYVDTSMRKAAPSLLSQQMTEMSPEQIGHALIELTGRQGLLDTEEEQRGLLASHQEELARQQTQDQSTRAVEDADLAEVHNRTRSRERLAEGEHLWRLHYAAGYREVHRDQQTLQQEIDDLDTQLAHARTEAEDARTRWTGLRDRTDLLDAEHAARERAEQALAAEQEVREQRGRAADRLRALTDQRAVLRDQATDWSGTPLPDLSAQVEQADTARRDADYTVRDAERTHRQAEERLRAARTGSGGDTETALRALAEAHVPARLLLDEVTLTETARPGWEPRLWPHRDAVVVAAADRDAAVAVLASVPGAELVAADGPLDQPPGPLPDGVSATVPIGTFLTTLAERSSHHPDPDRALDSALSRQVLGGFTREIAGRAARVQAAEQALAEATATVEQARRRLRTAEAAHAEAAADRDAAQSATRLAEVEVEIDEATDRVAQLDEEFGIRHRAAREARTAENQATGERMAHQERIKTAEQQVRNREAQVTDLDLSLSRKHTEISNLRVDYWASSWGDTLQAAQAFLDEQPEAVRTLRRRTLSNRSAEALKEALDAYTANLTEIPPDLNRALEMRQRLADGETGVGRDTVSFESVARPLRDLLDARLETDQVLESRILRQRAERETRIESLLAETRDKQEQWDKVQDMISARIEDSLRRISISLDRLVRGRGGFGAELKVVPTRPTTTTSVWKWEVTPCWRRSPSGPMVTYKKVANGAQVKVFAIQLVLAALLADDGAQGRVLVIDELGNSLGDVHRRDVLRDLNAVAADQNVTIIGTCQDSVIGDAAGECGEILWFSHANEADAYNRPTRMWAYDDNGDRVRLTGDWLTTGRSLA